MWSNRKRQQQKKPFIILAMIHFGLMLFTFCKQMNRKKLLVLLLSNIGLGYFFDYIVVGIFKAYKYKPNIFPNKSRYLNHITGSVLSQSVYIPITAFFITAFRFGWKMKIFFALYFSAIERLFLRWRIYRNNWWKTHYTFSLVLFFFWLSDQWFALIKRKNPFILFFTFFNTIQVTWKTVWFPLTLLHKVRFGRGKYYTWKEHFLIVPIYFYIVSFLIAWLLRKGGRMTDGFVICLLMAGQAAARKAGILKIKSRAAIPATYFLFIYLFKRYKSWVYDE
nr:hypothetical protein [Evansella caseinilytica]